MPDFVTLSCPTCGGKLQITEDVDRFACEYCGNEHVVKRGGGIVTLAPVVEGLNRIQVGTDRTAAELTIRRLKEEIPALAAEVARLAKDAWNTDMNGLETALRRVRPGFLPRPWETQAAECLKLVYDLTHDESSALITEYENQPVAFFNKGKKNKTVTILKPLPELNKEIKQKVDQLEEQLRLADGP